MKDGYTAIPVTLNKTAGTDTGALWVPAETGCKNTANVSTRMMGYITGFHVQVGQQVQAGQLLVNVNNTDIVAKGGQVSAINCTGTGQPQQCTKRLWTLFKIYTTRKRHSQRTGRHAHPVWNGKSWISIAAQQMKNEVNAQLYSNITALFPEW